MERYRLYWIEKEVANYFYHKGDILYRFLLEYRRANNYYTSIQYEYVTNNIPHKDLVNYIIESCNSNNIVVRQKGSKLKLSDGYLKVELKINEKSIDIYAKTLLCAENIVFPILRSFQSSFFIVGEDKEEYGWISPFLKNREKSLNESLYSLP